jgi:hypothetical protein
MKLFNKNYQRQTLGLSVKTLLASATVLLFSTAITAQNKNVTKTTTTTTRTVNTPEGQKKFVKEEKTAEVQKVELGAEKPNTLNIETVASPVITTSTTTITNPDGSTRTVNTDRSGFYQSNGMTFKLDLDAAGYTMTRPNTKPALLRITSTNSYIYKSKNQTAIGYFDTNGDLNIELYDDKTDKVYIEKYQALK